MTDLDEIIKGIDRQRLGLDEARHGAGRKAAIAGTGFRAIGKTKAELPELYHVRMSFLADWSNFLKYRGITTAQQSHAQVAFQRAQSAFRAAHHDFLSVAIAAGALNPQTGKPELMKPEIV